jgi:hypothetical protein
MATGTWQQRLQLRFVTSTSTNRVPSAAVLELMEPIPVQVASLVGPERVHPRPARR